MSFKIQNDLRSFLAAELKADIPELSVELCPEGFDGDVTISCFPLAKAFRTNPMALAAKSGEFLSSAAVSLARAGCSLRSASRSYERRLVRLKKASPVRPLKNRAVPPVGRTWLGPAM